MDAPHFASDLVEKDGALVSTRPSAARLSSSMRLSSRPRSVIRYVVLALDVSAHLEKTDLRPTRISFLRFILPPFIDEFFDQNPLSQLAVVVTRDGRAELISPLSSNARTHIAKVLATLSTASIVGAPGSQHDAIRNSLGEPSLQNTLAISRSALSTVPAYGRREILLLFGSLKSRDPGDVFAEVKAVAESKIRVSVVGLSAEMYVLKYMCDACGGAYTVAGDGDHLKQLLYLHIPGPPSDTQENCVAPFIQMGFPSKVCCNLPMAVPGRESLVHEAFACPRCEALSVDVCSDCRVCGLKLASSVQLARSYHHICPVATFAAVHRANDAMECSDAAPSAAPRCHGCGFSLNRSFDGAGAFACSACGSVYCSDCDAIIHETLHVCLGCISGM